MCSITAMRPCRMYGSWDDGEVSWRPWWSWWKSGCRDRWVAFDQWAIDFTQEAQGNEVVMLCIELDLESTSLWIDRSDVRTNAPAVRQTDIYIHMSLGKDIWLQYKVTSRRPQSETWEVESIGLASSTFGRGRQDRLAPWSTTLVSIATGLWVVSVLRFHHPAWLSGSNLMAQDWYL